MKLRVPLVNLNVFVSAGMLHVLETVHLYLSPLDGDGSFLFFLQAHSSFQSVLSLLLTEGKKKRERGKKHWVYVYFYGLVDL